MPPLSIRLSLVIISCALVSTGCREQTNEEKDFQSTKKLAEAGAYQAYFDLGLHYEKGIGVQKDDQMAVECYKRALGRAWEEERKLPSTLEGWKRLAGESEFNDRVKYMIGLYYEGEMLNQTSDIQINVGGEAVPVDLKEAIKWHKEATKRAWPIECVDSYVRLAKLIDNEKSSREYLQTASSMGSAEAKTMLADYYLYNNKDYFFYENGRRMANMSAPRPASDLINFVQGIALLEEAATIGGSAAAIKLEWIYNNYDNKYPLIRDEGKAWMYERMRHEQSSAAHICKISFLGQTKVPKLASMLPNLKEGTTDAFLLRIQALNGDANAIYALSVYYAYGRVFSKDTTEAIRLCKKSASLGHPLALISMGNRYYDGNGVIRDEIEAYACWNLAGREVSEARKYISKIDRTLSETARLAGQKRSRELLVEIERTKAGLTSK